MLCSKPRTSKKKERDIRVLPLLVLSTGGVIDPSFDFNSERASENPGIDKHSSYVSFKFKFNNGDLKQKNQLSITTYIYNGCNFFQRILPRNTGITIKTKSTTYNLQLCFN